MPRIRHGPGEVVDALRQVDARLSHSCFVRGYFDLDGEVIVGGRWREMALGDAFRAAAATTWSRSSPVSTYRISMAALPRSRVEQASR